MAGQRFSQIQGVSFALLLIWAGMGYGQSLFTEEGQVFALYRDTPGFAQLGTNPSNGALRIEDIRTDMGVFLDAIGYSRLTRLIYGIDPLSRHLYRIDANGIPADLGDIGLDPSMTFQAGDVSPDGKTYVLIAQSGGKDRFLLRVDLSSPGFPFTQAILPGVTGMVDIAFHPTIPNLIYGYDAINRSVVSLNMATGDINGLTILLSEQEVYALYFTAFEELIAFGTANSGVAGAMYLVDQQTGVLDVITTGPVYRILDMAHIPYSIEIRNEPSGRVAFPCNELLYTFSVINQTGESHANTVFEARLPDGFQYLGLAGNTLGGWVNFTGNTVFIHGMPLPQGNGLLKMRVKVGDVSPGVYRIQGRISQLDERFGGVVVSDDPISPQWEDSTRVTIGYIEEDSLVYSRFVCAGDSIVIGGIQFGSQVQWNTGSTSPFLTVSTGGQYVLEIVGACKSTIVVYNVTMATCPFTIEVDHRIIPEQTLPCSEVIFRFTIDNDSGAEREGLSLSSKLPDGFSFVSIEQNPFGGVLDDGKLPYEIHIHGMSVPVGRQDLDLRIAVGNVPPGQYRNQGRLDQIPVELGPFRLSDDPRTPEHDSTILEVLGVETDTLYVEEILCPGNTLFLDGSLYGIDHLWFNGNTEPAITVDMPGLYELVVFDGCDPTYIFFKVRRGEPVEVTFDSAIYHVRLGDSVMLVPVVINADTILDVTWSREQEHSLSCIACPVTVVFPKWTTGYRVYATNTHCTDSADVVVMVDNTRRLFVPNIFTPNHDGINDLLILHSPDFGFIESFEIIDRWGNVLHRIHDLHVNDQAMAWDGSFGSDMAPPGTYLWKARITFLDGLTEHFAGTVSLIR